MDLCSDFLWGADTLMVRGSITYKVGQLMGELNITNTTEDLAWDEEFVGPTQTPDLETIDVDTDPVEAAPCPSSFMDSLPSLGEAYSWSPTATSQQVLSSLWSYRPAVTDQLIEGVSESLAPVIESRPVQALQHGAEAFMNADSGEGLGALTEALTEDFAPEINAISETYEAAQSYVSETVQSVYDSAIESFPSFNLSDAYDRLAESASQYFYPTDTSSFSLESHSYQLSDAYQSPVEKQVQRHQTSSSSRVSLEPFSSEFPSAAELTPSIQVSSSTRASTQPTTIKKSHSEDKEIIFEEPVVIETIEETVESVELVENIVHEPALTEVKTVSQAQINLPDAVEIKETQVAFVKANVVVEDVLLEEVVETAPFWSHDDPLAWSMASLVAFVSPQSSSAQTVAVTADPETSFDHNLVAFHKSEKAPTRDGSIPSYQVPTVNGLASVQDTAFETVYSQGLIESYQNTSLPDLKEYVALHGLSLQPSHLTMLLQRQHQSATPVPLYMDRIVVLSGVASFTRGSEKRQVQESLDGDLVGQSFFQSYHRVTQAGASEQDPGRQQTSQDFVLEQTESSVDSINDHLLDEEASFEPIVIPDVVIC